VTDLVWKSANELLVAGRLVGIIPVPR